MLMARAAGIAPKTVTHVPFAAVGAYAVGGGGSFDPVILLVIGLTGFGMRRYGLPVLPAVLGVILGPAAEQPLCRALQIRGGSVTGLVTTPFSVTVHVIVVLIVAGRWPAGHRTTARWPECGRGAPHCQWRLRASEP